MNIGVTASNGHVQNVDKLVGGMAYSLPILFYSLEGSLHFYIRQVIVAALLRCFDDTATVFIA